MKRPAVIAFFAAASAASWSSWSSWLTGDAGTADNDPTTQTKDEELRSFLMSTEWNWNDWRHVKFHAPTRGSKRAKFHAPTEDCEANLCTWHIEKGKLVIQWGEAGAHTLERRGGRLVGYRLADGERCSAVLVGQFEETLFDLDLYAVLGVQPSASAYDVKRAFRRLSLTAHPDKKGVVGNPASAKEFVTLRGAAEILTDASERARYDEHCRRLSASALAQPVEAFDPTSFERLVLQRQEASPGGDGLGPLLPWMVVFTMSPSSPCGPCHDLRAVVRSSAAALHGLLRVGTVHCDLHKALCQREMDGREYYPVVKMYAPGRATYIDLKQPELPSAAVLHLTVDLLSALNYGRMPSPTHERDAGPKDSPAEEAGATADVGAGATAEVARVDESPSCAQWAADGECVRNPAYMLPKCPRSCAGKAASSDPSHDPSMTTEKSEL